MTRSILVALVLMLSAPINAEYTTRVVAEDLAFPWSMVFINDDTFIVATRSGTPRTAEPIQLRKKDLTRRARDLC